MSFPDVIVGYWAFSKELVASVEALAKSGGSPQLAVRPVWSLYRRCRSCFAVLLLDTLRPPSAIEPGASAYKDWLHLNFAEPQSGAIGFINTSLHGAPWEDKSRTVGTVLVHSLRFGWKSYVEVVSSTEANIAPCSIALRDIAVAIDPRSSGIHVSSRGRFNSIHALLTVEPRGPALDFKGEMPLGSGWISWRLISNMSLAGEWMVDEARPSCLHALRIVRIAEVDRPFLAVDHPSAQRRFGADSISIGMEGRLDVPLHGCRAGWQLFIRRWRSVITASVEIKAAQGADSVVIAFVRRAAAQIITADLYTPGYGFIREIVGELWADR